MKASDIKFRCSSLAHLMVEPRKKSEVLSQTAIVHITDTYITSMFGRREEVVSKFFDKGNIREEEAITMLSVTQKMFYRKNKLRLADDFITGTPDVYLGDDILRAKHIYDTKCSWSIYTFFRAMVKPLDPSYYWQGQGYMRLTGAEQHTVAFCLTNGLAEQIDREKRNLSYRMDGESAEYKNQCMQIERNHIFDLAAFQAENPRYAFDSNLDEWSYDIPLDRRIHTYTFDRNEEHIAMIEKKVTEARQYIETELLFNHHRYEKQNNKGTPTDSATAGRKLKAGKQGEDVAKADSQ